jgi:anti-anti-sigma factor
VSTLGWWAHRPTDAPGPVPDSSEGLDFESRLRLRLDRGPVPTVAVTGDIDLATVGHVRSFLECFRGDGFVLDMSRVTFIDITGLHALTDEAAAGPVTLRRLPHHVARLLDITGTAHHFTIEM